MCGQGNFPSPPLEKDIPMSYIPPRSSVRSKITCRLQSGGYVSVTSLLRSFRPITVAYPDIARPGLHPPLPMVSDSRNHFSCYLHFDKSLSSHSRHAKVIESLCFLYLHQIVCVQYIIYLKLCVFQQDLQSSITSILQNSILIHT